MSFGVPSDAGMEGPQRRRHDRAQRRKIGPLISFYPTFFSLVRPGRLKRNKELLKKNQDRLKTTKGNAPNCLFLF